MAESAEPAVIIGGAKTLRGVVEDEQAFRACGGSYGRVIRRQAE